MHMLLQLLNPAVLGVLSVFLSIVWMLRDESDKTRPLLVFALILNLFYGLILKLFLGSEDGLEPFKFDHVLFLIDRSLGIQGWWIAKALDGGPRAGLNAVYQLLIPLMVSWFFVARSRRARAALVMAYIAELVTGPLFYAVLPACGPLYAFGANWLHPTVSQPDLIRLSGMPNAFPSLHMATAMVFVLFAPTKVWRGVAILFLIATALATISTGEHYVVDLVPGLVFGCFAVYAGSRRWRGALVCLGVCVTWSVALRLGFGVLLDHPWIVRAMTLLSLAMVVYAAGREWATVAQADVHAAPETPQVVPAL